MKLLKIIPAFIGCLLFKAALPQQMPPPPIPPPPDKNSWAWEAIGLDRAAHFAHLKKPLKIAIIDDGFDLDNPLWASHIAHNTAEIPDNNIDDDHNGKVDDYEGWDFGDNDETVRPDPRYVTQEYHGTRVLGVYWETLQQIAGDDLSGISILPIKAVSDTKLNNYLKEGYKGIEYAIEQKADIILCSWSGPNIAAEEKEILAKARAKGVMIIAAAGNFYAMQAQYPGAVSSVINVAATGKSGAKLRVSNYGVFVDISAPGDSLATFDPYKKTADAWLSATSAATPVVAAIVTALRSAYPQLSPEAIERLLKNTAVPLENKNPLYAGNLGAGLVNVIGIKEALERKEVDDPLDGPVFRQPKAFIDLQKLDAATPVKVMPTGKYKNIKFLLQSSAPPGSSVAAISVSAGLPDIRATIFNDGNSRDTILKKERLRVPFIVSADSLYLYLANDKKRVPPPKPATPLQAAWWYYEVITVDSSTLFCGNTITTVSGSEGTIEDGSGDLNYTGRNDCKWQITVPEGKKIRLSFEQFDTEPKIDQVYLFNGNSTKDPILAIFSGHALPPTVKSWGNTVLVWFLTSEENNFKGWKMHYKAIDK
ncbi:MAG TPA: S8 family serine peptidase [Puia sp.]